MEVRDNDMNDWDEDTSDGQIHVGWQVYKDPATLRIVCEREANWQFHVATTVCVERACLRSYFRLALACESPCVGTTRQDLVGEVCQGIYDVLQVRFFLEAIGGMIIAGKAGACISSTHVWNLGYMSRKLND